MHLKLSTELGGWPSYCLKNYLFCSQFHLTTHELAGLQQFHISVMQVYLKAWYTCQCATSAPRNDLKLLEELVAYETIKTSVAKAVVKSFTGHLWYLNETLIGLAFFYLLISTDMQTTMVAALEKARQHNPPQRIQLDTKHMADKQLNEFVTANTRKLFVTLNI